jgi:hypothetical protein
MTRRKGTQQVKINYEIQEWKATPFGGLYVFTEFLHQIGFHKRFTACFEKLRKVRQSSPSQNVALLAGMIVTGGERLYDIGRLANDQSIGELFDITATPKDTTLRDDLYLIGQKDSERAALLLDLNLMLFEKLDLKAITIDVDGTALPVDGHQQGAEKGYCPAELGARCFQSSKAICDETETVLAEWTFPGNTHCAKDINDLLRPLLDRLKQAKINIKLRMDAGYYSDALLLMLESYHIVSYEIAVPQHEWLKDKIKTLPYRSYYASDRQYCSFSYGAGLNGAFRNYYVERSLKPAGSQTDLFDQDNYHYRVVVSNRDRQPQVIFQSYNKRSRVEKHIEELKNQYALGKMISGNFDVTKALCWLCHLTFTLIGMLRQIAFRRKMKKYRLRRLRFLLFSAIGWFVNHAKQKTFYLALPRNGPIPFDAMMQRIWAF